MSDNKVAPLMPRPQQPARPIPTELHPAAMEAAAIYSDALKTLEIVNRERHEERERLEAQIRELEIALEASQRQCRFLDERLERETVEKEKYQAASITLLNHFDGAMKTMEIAKDAALRAADLVRNTVEGGGSSREILDKGMKEIAAQHPRNLDEPKTTT